ncbi:hypothetical protein [Porphyrobacter sp. AAP60]|uniref:hypothetical protein n=1 Tax=Porphyrobacter sp. AAP60 TaxID=1523423 RepID=UPI000A653038|nr:hypothetical protein [Porphyrobacter sp. AAP60]
MLKLLLTASLLAAPQIAMAQAANVAQPAVNAPAASAGPQPGSFLLPSGTMLVITPAQEISSKHIEEGQQVMFRVVEDVVEGNKVVIRRGSPVSGTITWKTGRAIGGKSGKFEVTFDSVSVSGRRIALNGMHRQEGRGNSVGALLGSMVISGRSAVMIPGQLVNVFTGQDFVYY